MDALSKPRVVAVGGPTATGKTALSVALAKEFGGEIINADSMQVYKNLNVGTAKPTAVYKRQILICPAMLDFKDVTAYIKQHTNCLLYTSSRAFSSTSGAISFGMISTPSISPNTMSPLWIVTCPISIGHRHWNT